MDQTTTTAGVFQDGAAVATASRPPQPAARLFTELLTPLRLPMIEQDIRALEARALVANVFFGADVLMAAGQHFRDAAAPYALAVWELAQEGKAATLVGLLPHSRPGLPLPGNALKGWAHPFVAHGTPLVDRNCARDVWAAMLADLGDRYGDLPGLLLKDVDAKGPFAELIARTARDGGLSVSTLAQSSRAVTTGVLLRTEAAGKAGKELRRQRRRLSETGAVAFGMVADSANLRRALEDFLTLEAAGWKGQQGSALVQSPDSANFTRAMLRSAAKDGKAAIAELRLDGRVIASALILISGTRGALWKIAYDEAFARFSPGTLLVEDITRWMRAQPELTLIDSCAHAGHAMIESLWTERFDVSDLVIGLRSSPAGLGACLARERLHRSLRARVKAVYHRLKSKGSLRAARAAIAG